MAPWKPTIRRAARCALVCALLAAGGGRLAGQSEHRGFYLYERADGTSNTLGFITRLDSTLGYDFNRYLAAETGIPVYFVRPSEAAFSVIGMSRANGIGNLRGVLRLTLASPALTYGSSLTVTAPTGDKEKGLSTGRTTYDWNNQFQRTFGRVTPFGAVGVANTVADTPLFVRPYVSQGLVTRFEGGGLFRPLRPVTFGAMAYAIEPSGEQTVISRVTMRGPPASADPGERPGRAGRGRPPVFEENPVTVGPADIARDRGASVWLSLEPGRVFDFQIGYSRSTTFALDTVFFGVGVNVGRLGKAGRR